MAELEIFEYEGEDYDPTMSFDKWLVALANYSPRFDRNNFSKMERHLETDEVFVLLSGTASLVIGEDKKVTDLEIGKIYNVKRGVWHQVFIDKGSKVLIVENSDTTKENSEYKEI